MLSMDGGANKRTRITTGISEECCVSDQIEQLNPNKVFSESDDRVELAT